MRAIIFVHRDTGQRCICACVQQIERFLENRNPDDWMVCPDRRWPQ